MQSDNTVRIDNHAAATLRYIRASMDAAASLALPGSAAIAAGVVGLLAMLLSSTASLREHWLAIWLIAAFVAAGVGSVLMAQRASLRALTFAGAPIQKFALCFAPSMLAGAVITAMHWHYGNPHAIAGTWLILYGCALIAASVVATRMIGVLGGLFFALGLLALALPDEMQVLALGTGFGGLHVLFGLLMRRTEHGR